MSSQTMPGSAKSQVANLSKDPISVPELSPATKASSETKQLLEDGDETDVSSSTTPATELDLRFRLGPSTGDEADPGYMEGRELEEEETPTDGYEQRPRVEVGGGVEAGGGVEVELAPDESAMGYRH